MYRLEHKSQYASGTDFIAVDEKHKAFATGNTAVCAWNVGTDNVVSTHATAREIRELSQRLQKSGYKPFRAGAVDEMDELHKLITED